MWREKIVKNRSITVGNGPGKEFADFQKARHDDDCLSSIYPPRSNARLSAYYHRNNAEQKDGQEDGGKDFDDKRGFVLYVRRPVNNVTIFRRKNHIALAREEEV